MLSIGKPEPTIPLSVPRTALAVHLGALATGLLHHLDHVIRHDVGWPLENQANGFTYSLAVYPIVAFGFWRTARGHSMRGYWMGVAIVGIVFVVATHAGPFAPDPVAHVYSFYDSPIAGLAAVAILVGLLASLLALLAVALGMPRRNTAPIAPHKT